MILHDFFKYIIFWNCIYFFKINNILKLKIGICITYSATSHHTVLFINCCHHTNTLLVFYVFFSCFLFILVEGVLLKFTCLCYSSLQYETNIYNVSLYSFVSSVKLFKSLYILKMLHKLYWQNFRSILSIYFL
jgi:hypothetical protein